MMQSNQQQKINVDNFEAQMPRPIMPCPAPAVVKGGEDDEFVVSHLGSVEVKAVAGIGSILGGGSGSGSGRRIAMNLPTTTTRGLQPNSGSFSPASTSSSYDNNNNNNYKTGDDVEFEKDEEKEKRMTDTTTNKGKNENGANQENVILYVELTKSPYEPDMIGEKGEYIFKKMKQLLLNNKSTNNRAMYDDYENENDNNHSDDNYDVATSEEVKVNGSGEKKKKKNQNKHNHNIGTNNDINPKMIRMFGPTNARCLIDAYELIDKSGMVYSQLWTKGNIRGNIIGVIPNHLLLLVLQSNRFIKAGELLLSGLCRDLEVYVSVNHALDDWKLYRKYKSTRATCKHYKFLYSRRDCYKCALFIARVHSCYVAFGKPKLGSNLMNKVRACLDIMEAHLPPPSLSAPPTSTADEFKLKSSFRSSTSTTATASTTKKRKKSIQPPTPNRTVSNTSSTTVTSSLSSFTTETTATSNNQGQKSLPPLKKRRGRPPKKVNKASTMVPPEAVDENAYEDEEYSPSTIPIVSSTSSSSKKLSRRQVAASKKKEGGRRSGNGSDRTTIEAAAAVSGSGGSTNRMHPCALSRTSSVSSASSSDSNANNNDANNSTGSIPTTPPHASSLSLQELISQFEDQYNEMGQRYNEMGVILTQMKTSIAATNIVTRTKSEQDIRKEVIDEISKGVLNSIPKR